MAKKFQVTILGVNSAYPIHGRHPSCQIVNYNDQLFMVDCGEGAQIQVSKYHIKRGKIDHIFISHLHGDHCYGLPGLLTSFALQGRKNSLSLHGPLGIRQFIKGIFDSTCVFLPYDLNIQEYRTEVTNRIVLNRHITVLTFPLKHRIPTMGFRFEEKINEYNINADAIKQYSMSIEEIKAAKNGKSIVRDGHEIAISALTLPKILERSYAYCSDTLYDTEIMKYIEGSTLLYHETTYLDDLKELAYERMHSTIGQAIDIAQMAKIEKLIIGHYSSRYKEVNIFLEMGLAKFQGLMLGEEGRTYTL